MTIATLASIDNKTTKVKSLREDRFGVFFSLSWFCFVGVLFLFKIFSSSLENFLISKNLVIIFKLSTIKKIIT